MNRTEYVVMRRATGDRRALEEIGAEYDALLVSLAPPAPNQALLAAAVARSEAVNAALAALRDSTDEAERARFEALRRLPFAQQAAELGL